MLKIIFISCFVVICTAYPADLGPIDREPVENANEINTPNEEELQTAESAFGWGALGLGYGGWDLGNNNWANGGWGTGGWGNGGYGNWGGNGNFRRRKHSGNWGR